MAFVQVMEFQMEPAEAVRLLEQYAEEAEMNNELEITQRGGEEFSARALEVKFTDVDVITDITI